MGERGERGAGRGEGGEEGWGGGRTPPRHIADPRVDEVAVFVARSGTTKMRNKCGISAE